jgi:hypothetical protein
MRDRRQTGPWLTLQATAVATMLISTSAAQASEANRLDAQCRSLLHRYVFDCACTADFLATILGAEHGEIVMKLWVFGMNGDNQSQEVLNLYLQFGRRTIDAAVTSFHRHRDRLPAFCMQQNGPSIAD